MKKSLTILVLLLLGAGTYSYFSYPAGCAKLAGDSGRDIGAIGQAVGATWQGHPRPGNGVGVSLQKFAHDTGHDLWHLASIPADKSAAVVAPAPDGADATSPSALAAQTPPPAPEPPKWKGPAVMPAKPDWTWITLEGDEYHNVKVLSMEEDAVTIVYTGGGRRVPLKSLGAEMQKELGYDPSLYAAASAEEQRQMEAQQAAAGSSPNMIEGWITDDYATGVAQARMRGKKVLLFFTGSTWCPTCIQMEKEIVPTAEFQNFGRSNYVMVKLEVAHQTPSGDPTLDRNQQLADKYNVHGVPTLIVVELDGKEIVRMEGCPATPSVLIDRFSPPPAAAPAPATAPDAASPALSPGDTIPPVPTKL